MQTHDIENENISELMHTSHNVLHLEQAEHVALQLKCFANADRLKILCVLKNGELCVQTIEKQTKIQQPTLSQQLTILRKAHVVLTRREGKQIYYAIQDHRVLALMESLYKVYCHEISE